MYERLQKYLARAGIASRRKCEELIQQGKVKVNQRVVTKLGTKIDPQKDIVEVKGKKLKYEEKDYLYIILNKPKGYLTTLYDPHKRPTILDLLTRVEKRVYPCGRLDFNSEGLVFLTNDGEVAYALTHPSKKIEKTYLVKVQGIPDQEKLLTLARGVKLTMGEKNMKLLSCKIYKLETNNGNTYLKIKIREGKKRQIRKMMEYIGHKVLELKRIQIGPLKLGRLKRGEFKYLNKKEIDTLRKFLIS